MKRLRAPARSTALGCALLVLSSAITTSITTSTASAAPAPKLTLADEAAAAPVPAVRKGVVVVAVGEGSADAAFVVAKAVYAHAEVRPGIVDRDAQILAGGALEPNAPKDAVELAELRTKIHGDDVASRLLMAEIARRTRSRAVALVFAPVAPETTPHVQLYDAADDAIEPTIFRPSDAKGDAKVDEGWPLLVSTMRARWSLTADVDGAGKSTKPEKTDGSGKGEAAKGESGKLITSSVWFWVALGAAVVAGGVVYLTTRDSGTNPTPLRVQWGK